MLRSYQRILDAVAGRRTKFFYPDGTPTPRGEIFREPMLAKTLRELAAAEKKAHGKRPAKLHAVRDLFYKGSIAKRIADFSREERRPDRLRATSANFHAEIDQPRTGTYRGYEIYKPGFWTQGPVMIEALNHAGGLRPQSDGPQQPGVSAHAWSKP